MFAAFVLYFLLLFFDSTNGVSDDGVGRGDDGSDDDGDGILVMLS